MKKEGKLKPSLRLYLRLCLKGFSFDDFQIPFSQNLSFLNWYSNNALARGGDVACGLTL